MCNCAWHDTASSHSSSGDPAVPEGRVLHARAADAALRVLPAAHALPPAVLRLRLVSTAGRVFLESLHEQLLEGIMEIRNAEDE
jgi:hypothetical protein